jgi:hypothetical protein
MNDRARAFEAAKEKCLSNKFLCLKWLAKQRTRSIDKNEQQNE